MQMSRRAKADINVRQADPEQTDPRPHHVFAVEAAYAVVTFRAGRRLGFGIQKAADQMPQ